MLTIALAGCSARLPARTTSVTAEEVRERLVRAAEKVQTVCFDMDLTVAVTGTGNRRVAMNLTSDVSGLVDNVAAKARTETKATVDLSGGGGRRDTSAVSYVVGDVLYTYTSVAGRGPSWVSTSLPAGSWAEVSQFGREVELLRQGQMTLLGTEKIEDAECYALAIKPDIAKMQDNLKRISGLMQFPKGVEGNLAQLVRSLSAKVWVATDTFLPVRDETELTMLVDSASIGLAPGASFEVKLTAKVRTRFLRYDEPLTIELPAEARGAARTP